MAQQGKPAHDPWRDLCRKREIRQVEIDEVVERFSLEERNAQALKKALLARMAELTRER